MADLFSLESTGDVAAGSAGSRLGTALDTGALRRKYGFGSRVSELAIAQDPFFRMVSKLSKKATDDPEFKFTERRPSFHKRYAYVVAQGAVAQTAADSDAALTAAEIAVDSTYHLLMGTDYLSSGNIGLVYGQANTAIEVGESGTKPSFFLPGQVIKVNMTSQTGRAASDTTDAAEDYFLGRIVEGGVTDVGNYVNLELKIVRTIASATSLQVNSYAADGASLEGLDISGKSIAEYLEPKRCYVVGTSHAQGSGYPQTWKDQPFSTGYGRTQIWKTAMAMDNTTRATVLKYEPNEWARVWREKLIEHKWDIEQSIMFGAQAQIDNEWYTQGAVDYISGYGNVFSLSHASKTQDDFLDDLSSFLDPRYNNANASLFFVDTATYNWLHKLSGYFTNNLEISPNFRADMALSAKKKVFGVDISVISTPYGDMNVARNIHLDGSAIKILAVNMRYCAYRPLVGNGLNRDTAIYVGVQTLENSGVDRRVDLIQTEAGMEWQMPEAHAYWA
jgi:hypothetical protein